jgi:hypothetical protein
MIRLLSLGVVMALLADGGSPPPARANAFDQLKSLAGEWRADLPGFGRIASSIRLVSNGTAL